jgi:UDP-N-acetylmuramoyl-tripeptide--D-alanyl-D-alanine ligase
MYQQRLLQRNNGSVPSVLMVRDTLQALQEIAGFLREKSRIPFIGITGSNGKTTSKEMIASVLGTQYSVLKNEGNYNNHIGVPLTLLRLEASHEIGIVEMGMSSIGEIRRLCEIARPETGIVTNIGAAHLEFLGSLEKVKEAKGELVEFINGQGTIVLNADDPMVIDLKDRVRGKLLTYGIEDYRCDVRADRIHDLGIDGSTFLLRTQNKEIEIRLSVIGGHNIYNALAAASAGLVHHVALEDIKKGLEAFRGLSMRMEILSLEDDVKVINDSYNANPFSMKKAVEVLSKARRGGRTFLVAGDMLELGDVSEKAHEEVGEFAAEGAIDFLIVVGELASFMAKGALKKGMKENNVFLCETVEDAGRILNERIESRDVVLIKGSRGMKMERIIDKLKRKKEIR